MLWGRYKTQHKILLERLPNIEYYPLSYSNLNCYDLITQTKIYNKNLF